MKLSTILISSLAWLLAACSPAALTSSPAPTHYRSEANHVEVDLPAGWAVSEGPEFIARPFEGLLAFNSWGKEGFWTHQVKTETESGEGYTYDREAVLGQVPADGAYIVLLELSGGPKQSPEDYGPEYEAQDLHGLLLADDCRKGDPTSPGFYKWGRYLGLGVYCGKEVSDQIAAEVNQLLESWRFDRVPAGDFGWATVTARNLLPAMVHPESFPILTTGHSASSVQEGKIVRTTQAASEAGDVVEVTFYYRWDAAETGPIADDCPVESCHWWRFEAQPDGEVRLVEEAGAVLPGEKETSEPMVSSTPTITSLPPLLPTWTVTPAGASELDLARHTLLTFFTLLHDGRYADAALLYGGSYEDLRVQNPDVPPDDAAALWQASCTHQTPCLLVSRIVDEKSITQGEFVFVVEFIWIDGTLFKLGPCCGATEAEMPPVWQFPYTVKKIDGQFQVMEGPVYIP